MTAIVDLEKYNQYLESKITVNGYRGIEIADSDINPIVFPHQRDAIRWALRNGQAMVAMSFGLGKTLIQLEIARILVKKRGDLGDKFLIVCPLGVKHQFIELDGPMLGMKVQYVRTDKEVEKADTPFLITNYERVRDGNIHPQDHNLIGVSLDEGSILRNLGNKTSDIFADVFADVPFKFCCTATPAPNQYREIIYYARWLGIMDSGQALTRWFQRDVNQAGNLTIHPQHEKEFWLWVASWALFVYKPSDLGYDDTGYDLPELRVHWHRLATDHTRAFDLTDNRGQYRLLMDTKVGISEQSTEKRESLSERLDKMQEIIAQEPDEHYIIWHQLEDERRAIEQTIPDVLSIYGTLKDELKEERIIAFGNGEFPIVALKPVMSGMGCNLQYHCSRNIYLGINFKFQEFIQSIHRTYRFQQDEPVDVHIIYTEAEDNVIRILREKWERHNELTAKMQAIIKEYGLAHEALTSGLRRRIGIMRQSVKEGHFTAVNNDCVYEMENLADDSVDLIHTSIPFGDHYEYTVQYEDFGHNHGDEKFFEQMDFLIPDLYRVLKPGRIAAIHVKDRILYGHQTPSGFMEVGPFSDLTVASFRKHGFLYEGRRTIVTDVVRENNSTYRLGWTEMTKDSSKMGSGLPEYLLLFRKPPTDNSTQRADDPVTHEKEDITTYRCSECGKETDDLSSFKPYKGSDNGHPQFWCPFCKGVVSVIASVDQGYSRGRWQIDAHSFWRSSGDRFISSDMLEDLHPDRIAKAYAALQAEQVYDHEQHVELKEMLDSKGHLPARFMLLPPKSHSEYVWDDVAFMQCLNAKQSARRRRNHTCPLPFDIVDRVIRLYSNEGELVFDPFAGLFTVPVRAVKLGRRGYGVELNSEYWDDGVRYCRLAEIERASPTLFDWLAVQVAEGVMIDG